MGANINGQPGFPPAGPRILDGADGEFTYRRLIFVGNWHSTPTRLSKALEIDARSNGLKNGGRRRAHRDVLHRQPGAAIVLERARPGTLTQSVQDVQVDLVKTAHWRHAVTS